MAAKKKSKKKVSKKKSSLTSAAQDRVIQNSRQKGVVIDSNQSAG